MKTRKRTRGVDENTDLDLGKDSNCGKVDEEEELGVLFQALASGNVESFDQDVINKYRSKTIEELLTMQCEMHSECIRKYALKRAEEFTSKLEESKYPNETRETHMQIRFLLFWYCSSIFSSVLNRWAIASLSLSTVYMSIAQNSLVALFAYVCVYNFSNQKTLKQPSSETILTFCIPTALFTALKTLSQNSAIALISTPLLSTVMSASPLFTSAICRIFLGNNYSFTTFLSLFPITLGIFIASMDSFGDSQNLLGMCFGLGSSFSQTCARVLNKLAYASGKLSRHQVMMYEFGYSSLILLLYSVVVEEPLLSSRQDLTNQSLLIFMTSGVLMYFQVWASSAVLETTGPLAHSIADIGRRFMVILVSVFWEGQGISLQLCLAAFVSLFGVLLYSLSSQKSKVVKSKE